MIWTCTVPLCPESKSNSRRIFRDPTGRRIIAKSDKARTFVATAVLMFRAHGGGFAPDDKLWLSWSVRFPDYRRDFVGSHELIADALQQAGIIKNDRQIRVIGESWADDEIGEPLLTVKLECVGKLPWKPKAKKPLTRSGRGA